MDLQKSIKTHHFEDFVNTGLRAEQFEVRLQTGVSVAVHGTEGAPTFFRVWRILAAEQGANTLQGY
jgi:hypothetical protein